MPDMSFVTDYRSDRKALCVILGGGRGQRLFPLTKERAKPAVPLGGKYRLIDVPISNCLNSGLNQIYILTQFQSTSLHQHIKGSYVFDRFSGGFIEILAAEQRTGSEAWYQGTADAVRQNLHHFGTKWDEILILSGDQLYRMDFRLLLKHHRKSNADMTICALPVDAASASASGIINVNPEGRVFGFKEKPPAEKLRGLETDDALFRKFGVEAAGRPYLASMGIYVFSRSVLYEELNKHQHVDFGYNLFPASIIRHKVHAYVFDGYWEDIGTVKSFHEANLQMARMPPPFSFNSAQGLIYTRPRTLPSTVIGRIEARESLIADGCRIGDAKLDNSIVGIRGIIGSGVKLARTLVMGADFYEWEEERAANKKLGRPDIGIGNDVIIEDAIVDKNARIGSNVVIRDPSRIEQKQTEMYVVRDGIICILKGAVIPSGTTIGG